MAPWLPLTMAEMAFNSSGLSCSGVTSQFLGRLTRGARQPSRGECVGEEGLRTSKPAEVAQTLSPAALTRAALSMWPVLTRLLRLDGQHLFGIRAGDHDNSS